MTDTPDLRTLAAVLPAHRRQILEETADALEQLLADAMLTGRENAGLDAYAGASQVAEWLRRLASAAPETAPRPRQNDETAPAVPEATPAPAEGDTALGTDQIPDQVYRDAAEAGLRAAFAVYGAEPGPIRIQFEVDDPGHRAAVASAYRAGQEGARQRLAHELEQPGSNLCDCPPREEDTPISPRTGEPMDHHCDCRAVSAAAVLLGADSLTSHAKACGHGTRFDEFYTPRATPADGQDGDGP